MWLESETPPIRADWRPRRAGKRCASYQAVGLAAGVRAEISLSRGACQVPVEWTYREPISVLMASMAALEWALPVRRPVTWGSLSRGHLHISAFELFGDALAPVGAAPPCSTAKEHWGRCRLTNTSVARAGCWTRWRAGCGG